MSEQSEAPIDPFDTPDDSEYMSWDDMQRYLWNSHDTAPDDAEVRIRGIRDE